ncbi:unnamed protein product [Urochloa decumbens]|uniref:F-box domain-containing protein n=1 Tax=Urochloa decumbens TaxID=240449 RepID=A0ABC9GC84_9POAL
MLQQPTDYLCEQTRGHHSVAGTQTPPGRAARCSTWLNRTIYLACRVPREEFFPISPRRKRNPPRSAAASNMAAPLRPPAPTLMPELVEEILLRVPPDDPATLVRAALVCKPWCRVVASAHFRRRLRDLRRGHAAPLLGFLCDLRSRGGSESLARFVPTAPSSSFRPPRAADFPDLRAHDARHGRVLLHTYPYGCGHPYFAFLVWDPATDERREIPRPPRYPDSWKATVLCAATTAGGACDHVDCHRGPFVVVFVGISGGGMFSCIYSSEAAAWSKSVPVDHPGDRVGWERSALAGNALYFVLENSDRILRYDLGTKEISVVELPGVRINRVFASFEPIELTTMEDGRLGFARVEGSRLCIWSRDDKDVGWVLTKVIGLTKLLRLGRRPSDDIPQLVGFAEGVGVVFLNVGHETFTVDLKSEQARKVYEGSSISCAIPYMNFCTPVLGAPTTDDGPRASTSSQGCSCTGSDLLSQGK